MRLHDVDDPDAQMLSRFASSIQLERQDFNGRMLTIRRSDLRVLAACMGRSLEDLGVRLEQLGLRACRLSSRSDVSAGRGVRPTRYADRTLVAPRTTSPPPTTSVKILVPGNHLMVGLLGQRDELLRMIEAAFPVQILVRGNEITVTGEAPDAERVGRLFEELVVLLEQGHELDSDGARPVDRDVEGRPAPHRGAHHRGRARPQEHPPEDRRGRSATSTRCATTR